MSTKQQTKQQTEGWLRTAPLADIKAAYEAGELSDVLGAGEAVQGQPVPADGPLAAHHLARMTPEEIVTAHQAGRLDAVIGKTPAPAK